MTASYTPPSLRELTLPARDLARGVRHSVEQSKRLAEPIRQALPEPVLSLARELMSDFEGMAASARGLVRRGAGGRINGLEEIAAAKDPGPAFARAAVFGLEAALERLGRADLMASETLAAVAWRAAGPGQASAEAAARLVLALEQGDVVGLVPGTPFGMGPAEGRLVRQAAVATMLWMLVARETPEDEAALLGLCVDVVGTLEAEAAEADAAGLARLLSTYAEAV